MIIEQAHLIADLLEGMKGFSSSDLKAILRHAMRTIERARESGRWEPGKEGDQT